SGLSGCITAFGPKPPEDPAAFDYVYRADDERKAPHPARFEGAFERVSTTNAALAASSASFRVGQRPPASPPGFPALQIFSSVTVLNASGEFRRVDGSVQTFENRTIRLSTNAQFDVTGVESWTVRSAAIEAAGGRLRVDAGLEPPPLLRPVEPAVSFTAGADGARATEARFSFVTQFSVPMPGSNEGEPGDVWLRPGRYGLAMGSASFVPQTPVAVQVGSGSVALKAPGGRLELRGATQPSADARIDVAQGSGTIDVTGGRASLDLSAVQWWTNDRPRFEAALRAELATGGTEAAVELREGQNQTFWIRVGETSRVGSAPNVHPRLERAGLNATYGWDWYGSPDPNLAEVFGSAFKNLFFGLFFDFTVTSFAPGEAKFLPLYVEIDPGTAPGTHAVVGSFLGDNARSNEVRVVVTVPS
ncbi:MAG TPA: hypothetical protein VM681_09620, partial [Candidatus Thermoplasmatota archaeon]|nr:hypothetical protein [Candidatus Thermoplasmatota archaeon]